jgi:hypothetical protein
MPDNSQSETCVEKPMKTLHKTNFFRIHLSAKDATREKPFADVSFYLNKTHIFEDQLVYRTRPTNRKIGLTGLTGPSSFFVFLFFIILKKQVFERSTKTSRLCGEMRCNFNFQKTYVLTKRNKLECKKSGFAFREPRNRSLKRPHLILQDPLRRRHLAKKSKTETGQGKPSRPKPNDGNPSQAKPGQATPDQAKRSWPKLAINFVATPKLNLATSVKGSHFIKKV